MRKVDTKYVFRVNTPGLLQEIQVNPQCSILAKPITIFAGLLGQVADRAARLNDPILNDLMCKLALYEIANPYSVTYNAARLNQIRVRADKLRSKEQS